MSNILMWEPQDFISNERMRLSFNNSGSVPGVGLATVRGILFLDKGLEFKDLLEVTKKHYRLLLRADRKIGVYSRGVILQTEVGYDDYPQTTIDIQQMVFHLRRLGYNGRGYFICQDSIKCTVQAMIIRNPFSFQTELIGSTDEGFEKTVRKFENDLEALLSLRYAPDVQQQLDAVFGSIYEL